MFLNLKAVNTIMFFLLQCTVNFQVATLQFRHTLKSCALCINKTILVMYMIVIFFSQHSNPHLFLWELRQFLCN